MRDNLSNVQLAAGRVEILGLASRVMAKGTQGLGSPDLCSVTLDKYLPAQEWQSASVCLQTGRYSLSLSLSFNPRQKRSLCLTYLPPGIRPQKAFEFMTPKLTE